MRALQEQDFDKMAARVVDRFMSGDKLADAATHEAMGGQLAPDQIERLVQAANTMAFLRLMEQQKAHAGAAGGSPDMTQEFDPIDPRQIMQQIVGQTDVPHMGAPEMPQGMDSGMGMSPGMDHEMPLPNEQAPPRDGDGDGKTDDDGDHDDDDDDGPFPKGKAQKAKDKEKAKPKKSEPKAEKDTAKEAAFRSRRQRKLLDVLEDQYKQAEWAFEDALAGITRQLKVAHGAPTVDAFEKDALALDSSEIGVVVQNVVRASRGWSALDPDATLAKVASLTDRHVVIETNITRAFEQLVKIATDAHKLRQAADYLRVQCD
jgi:hypothetical protein